MATWPRVSGERSLLVLVSAVLLLEAMLFGALGPLLAHYVGTLHISHAQAGLLVGSEAAGSFVIALPAGYLASRWGYKETVVLGLAVLVACTLGFGRAHSFGLLVTLRFAQGCASTTAITGALAWLTGFGGDGARGKLLGAALGAAAIGSLLGPVLGAIALAVGTASAFSAVAAILAVLGVGIVAMRRPAQRDPPVLRSLAALGRHTRLRVACWLVLLEALIMGAITVMGPLRLDALGWGSDAIAGVFIAGAALQGLVLVLCGRWIERHDERRIGAAVTGLLTILLLGVGLSPRATPLALFLVATTAVLAPLSLLALSTLTAGVEDVGLDRGLGTAMLSLAWAPGHAIGAVAGGALSAHGTLLVACALPIALCLLTTRLLLGRERG